MKKLAFFDQNHGLTPLGKCDFWDWKIFYFIVKESFFFETLKKKIFFLKKKFLFYLEHYQTFFVVLF